MPIVVRRLLPFVMMAVLGVVHALSWSQPSPGFVWRALGVGIAPLVVFAIVYLHREEALRDTFKLVPGDVSRGIASAFAALLVTYGIGLLAARWAPLTTYRLVYDVLQLRQVVPSESRRPLFVVAWAVSQELVWRGAVTHALEERFGSSRAPWIAGLMALASVAPCRQPPELVAALVINLTASTLTSQFRRVWPAFIAHATFSWISLELIVPYLLQTLQQRP